MKSAARSLSLSLVLAAGLHAPAQAMPTFAEVRAAHRPSDVTLLDRHGMAIQTVRVDKQVRRLPWVALQDVSPALLQAIVLGEDKRFYEHSGVDWNAVAMSAWGNLWNTRTRGASTLTMQLAGLIGDGLARPEGGRSVSQKISQAVMATRLESNWTKSEILEAYLNSVAFRGEVVGIDALSLTLFGKHPSGLDQHESAIAAALLRGPNAKADVVAQRACGVLELQQTSCVGVTALTATALAHSAGMPLGEQLAPHFARRFLAANVEAGTSATTIVSRGDTPLDSTRRTTIDAALQRVAIAALHRQLTELGGRNVEDGAVVVLDNATGEALAWVGSSGALSDASQVDGVLARRQPGSTLKPFVYELAFERRLITPASLIDDSPAQLETQSGLYLPQNYDHDFKGWVSARTALGSSLNVPAVRVGAMLGPDALVERLNALGLALPKPGGFYGNSLALGSADVSLLALTNAYRAFANSGWYSPVRFKPTPSASTASKRVADAAAVFLTTDILADNNARVRTFGMNSQLATRGFAAVKTGTSKDMRDNWCVGFTDLYTVGVWIGNASGEAMHDVSGVSGAAPIWQTLAKYLHDGRPSKAPRMPPGVIDAPARFEANLIDGASGKRAQSTEPARDEFFIQGTEQITRRTTAQVGIGTQRFGISSPRDGSIFAIDPDMPPQVQRIVFEGERGVWVLDGKRLGSSRRIAWAPWPGRHQLELIGPAGQTVQAVRFEVRGADIKATSSTNIKPR